MKGLKVVRKVLEDQPDGYYSLSWKKGSKWKDEFFDSLDEMEAWVDEVKEDNRDLYFCSTTLKNPQRRKENVLPSIYLWQDLDEVDPRKITPRPTIAWESSPHRYQALWKLDKHYTPSEIEYINRALAKKVGADQGSWILTKVLRIPGTHNYKYEEAPQGRLMWKAGKVYTQKEIVHFTEPETIDADTLLSKYWDRIPERARNLLTVTEVSPGTRSDTLWYLEHELAKANIPLEEIYVIIKNSAWNKFKGRSDEQTRLSSEIARAFEDEGGMGSSQKQSEDFSSQGFILENDTGLMSDMSLYPGWLIKNFWTRKSHGIVAGEPKSFKSTLVMDMAVSVASGKPFLGQYEVVDKGPVVIIQNENAAWIMRDRMSKIRASKGLIGEVDEGDNEGQYHIKFPTELPIYYINQQGFSLSNQAHKEELEKLLTKIKPRLVVFDPLYLMFDGDINSAKDLNPVLSWLLYLKDRHEFSLVLVHHWGKAKSSHRGGQRMLGSTTLHGWIESAWYISVKGASVEEPPETGDSLDVETPSSQSSLRMEREFRGAGRYPLIDITVGMGEFGSDTYSVEVGVAQETGKDAPPTDDEVRCEVRDYLEIRHRADIAEISKELGVSQRVVRKACTVLKDENFLSRKGNVCELIQ